MITSTSSSSISVKPEFDREYLFTFPSSPVLEIRAVARPLRRSAADIQNPVILSRLVVFGAHQHPRIALFRDRIGRDAPQIALLDELLQLRRIGAGIGIVIIERLAQRIQVRLQCRLARALDAAGHHGRDQAREQGDEQQNQQQLDQGKAARAHLTTPCSAYRRARYSPKTNGYRRRRARPRRASRIRPRSCAGPTAPPGGASARRTGRAECAEDIGVCCPWRRRCPRPPPAPAAFSGTRLRSRRWTVSRSFRPSRLHRKPRSRSPP